MNLQETRKKVLNALYEVYMENPGGIMDVTSIIKEQGGDPYEIGSYLKDYDLIRDVRFGPGMVHARISLAGIEEVKPGYLKEKTENVISALGLLGKADLMEILSFEQKDMIKARDIAGYLESNGVIKQPMYGLKEVIIELTLEGREYYENNKPFSFNWKVQMKNKKVLSSSL